MPDNLADWLAHLEAQHPKGAAGIELGLERVRGVSRALGQCQRVPLITVGGTNGKGSTCAMLESILGCAGYRVGLYTSPHLLDYTERVRLGGVAVGSAALCKGFARVEAARGDTALTYFEFGTLAAWECFAADGVDVVILEVGLGGRLDAVNIYDPDCALVTAIDIDHTEYLGATREEIGFEKAGIFRANKPALCADPAPPQRLCAHAEAIGAKLRLLDSDFGYRRGTSDWQYWSGHAGQRLHQHGLPHPALRGVTQWQNACAALAALEAVADRLPVARAAIDAGLRTVALPGRFQIAAKRPTVVLDVAHNPQAARVLADNLDALAVDEPFGGRTWAVFGMLRDKDIAGVAQALASRVTHWLPCALDGARATNAAQLARILEDQGITPWRGFATPADAFRYAREKADEDDRIVVFGSFQTVADVLRGLA